MILYYLITRQGNRAVSLAFGLLIAGVGAYYVLRNTFGITMPQIDWDLVWPVIVLLLGLAILSRALGWHRPSPNLPRQGGETIASQDPQGAVR